MPSEINVEDSLNTLRPTSVNTSGIQAERPIIMSGDNPTLILEGRKTQTRRIIANEARGADRVIWISKEKGRLWPGRKDEPYEGWAAQVDKLNGLHLPLKCPYGVAGDRLYVREPFVMYPMAGNDGAAGSIYRADNQIGEGVLKQLGARWALCPKHHARSWLEITKVRVERLQDISEEDAKAEGVPYQECGRIEMPKRSHVAGYAALWDSLHGKGAWDKNPWVWVLEFRLSPDKKTTNV